MNDEKDVQIIKRHKICYMYNFIIVLKTQNFYFMKRIIITLVFVGIATVGFSQKKMQPEWQDFSKAINATDQNKITMVYVYNTPCNLCTTTEETILADTTVINTLKKNFIATKFYSDTKEDVIVKGKTFPYMPSSETSGVNMYAIILLGGKMGFPTFVFLDKDGEKIGTHFPVNTTAEFLLILQYYSSGDYKNAPYEEWIKKQ